MVDKSSINGKLLKFIDKRDQIQTERDQDFRKTVSELNKYQINIIFSNQNKQIEDQKKYIEKLKQKN